MNEYSIHKQEKILKILIELCQQSPSGYIYQPKNFESNFQFIDLEHLITILQILENKGYIFVQYADLPESFNIYELHITPDGYDYHPQKAIRTKQIWIERLYGFIAGVILSVVVTYLIPFIMRHEL